MNAHTGSDWFDASGGLRFTCTMCGSCCTGPRGFVAFTDDEAADMARELGVSVDEFFDRYTREARDGGMVVRSLVEIRTKFGYDCVFLDREKIPGKAVCGLYESRPAQCRTWPFWKSNVSSRNAWDEAARTCPGMNTGRKHDADHVRLTRDRSPL